jgi:hypothetical protein
VTSSISNSYQNLDGEWLRGNFHGHSAWASRCASVRLRDAVRRYLALGAAFTSFTDHDRVTSLARARARAPDILLLQGFEHSSGANLVFLGERVMPLHRLPLDEAMRAADGLLTFACHPRPRRGEEHWTLERLKALPRLPDGVEVYNGHYGVPRMTAKGCVPLYADFWDEALTAGLRLWGFANDDSHNPADFGNAWNMVCARARSAAEIFAAARAGRFYATTGLLPEEIRGEGAHLAVRFAEPVTGRFVGPGGRVLAEAENRLFEHRLGAERYARFEAEHDGRLLFLQPVFRA